MGSFSNSPFRASVDSLDLSSFGLMNLNSELIYKDLNFQFEAGSTYQICGQQGDCSELLRSLAFLKSEYLGDICINGKKFSEFSFEEFQPYRLSIGYGFDQGGLLNNKTIRENLLLPLSYHGEVSEEEASALVETYLKKFKLLDYAGYRPAMTPGFVRKLCCVIRALIHQPQVLVLDSPTTAMDFERSKILMDEVSRQKDQGSLRILIFTTTYENAFDQWNGRRLFLDNAQLSEIKELAA